MIKFKSRSLFEYIYRSISSLIVKNWLGNTNITPNQVTLLRIPILLVSLLAFYQATYTGVIVGVLGIVLWDLFDVIDGDLAFFKEKLTPLGGFLEAMLDFTIGRIAGPLGFVLVLTHYIQNNDWTVWLWLFALIWIDNFYLRLLDAKNLYLSFSGEQMKDDIGESKFSIGKLFTDNILYWEFQIGAFMVLILFPYMGIDSYLVPVILYTVLYSVLSIFVILLIIKNRSKWTTDNG